jgi:hypothetical protein
MSASEGPWLDQKVIWVIDESYSGPLLLRVGASTATGCCASRAISVPSATPAAPATGKRHPELAYIRDGLNADGDPTSSSYPSGIHVSSPGCYAIQVDGNGFSRDAGLRGSRPLSRRQAVRPSLASMRTARSAPSGRLHRRRAHAVHVERLAEAVGAGFEPVQLAVGQVGVPADRAGDVPAVDDHVEDVELLEGRPDGGRAEVAVERPAGDGVVGDGRGDALGVVGPGGRRVGVDVGRTAEVDPVLR